MKTNIADAVLATPEGRVANEVLRSCVHCGFCNAACPTYRILGEELDGPRGRIYLIKSALEGEPVTRRVQAHLDRCLTCQACETSCPSGVEYHRLLNVGRKIVDARVRRPWHESIYRWMIRKLLVAPSRFEQVLAVARALRRLLPAKLTQRIPEEPKIAEFPDVTAERRMLFLNGCVQPVLAPNINAAAARVLAKLGIELQHTAGTGCCGALSYHLDAQAEGLEHARRNIDAWWPKLENGAEAIVTTASGCGAFVEQYGDLLANDEAYREKARRVQSAHRDLSEILAAEDLAPLETGAQKRVAFHCPCTLQHAQGLTGLTEKLLTTLGFELTPVADSNQCCGSAGAYSLLQKELSTRLLENKVSALEAGRPDEILTANIGCQQLLSSATARPVRHWIELVDEKLQQEEPGGPSSCPTIRYHVNNETL